MATQNVYTFHASESKPKPWVKAMYALLVCDDNDETAILSLVLQRVGLAVTVTDGLDRALRMWPQRPADMVLIALREGTSVEQVRRVRAETDVPLAIIAETADEDSLYNIFDAGADAAIARPYSAKLLVARLRALLRRSSGTSLLSLPTLSVGKITLDPSSRDVQAVGRPPRRLTHLEFRLLYTLMIHQGQTLPTEGIVERVWGYSGEGDRDLVRGLISRLRSKIEEDPKNPKYILTVSGIGYRLHNPEA